MIRVGIPREIKPNEGRVAITPFGVRQLVSLDRKVYVETNAGLAAGFTDADYKSVGAFICKRHEDVFEKTELVVKVKEPLHLEYPLIKRHHTLFTFFHFAGVPGLLDAMVSTGATCVAYETVYTEHEANKRVYPILAPMSKIAGEEAILRGVEFLDASVDVHESTVSIIGAGTVGFAAAEKAVSMGFKHVVLLDTNADRLRELVRAGFETAAATPDNIAVYMTVSSIVVGAAYVTGKEAPKLVTRAMLDGMPSGSVFVDVSIDQGGMTEVSTPTTTSKPCISYNKTKVMCVANMPGRVPNKASLALENAVMPYVRDIALYGHMAYDLTPELGKGVKILSGRVQS